MPNMSYCRFENTADDLEDCVARLEDLGGDITKLSDSERKAALRLLDLACEIADHWQEPMTAARNEGAQ